MGGAFVGKFVRLIPQLIHRHLTVSLEIPSKDKSYQWVLHWLTRQHQATSSSSSSSLFSASSRFLNQHIGVETHFVQHPSGAVNARFDFIPSTGSHWMKYKGRWIQVQREREKTMVDMTTGRPLLLLLPPNSLLQLLSLLF